MRPGGAITQSIDTFCAEPLDPFGDCLRGGVELARCGGPAQPSVDHKPHHGLSTFRRQRGILVAVHLVSPWNTEASQPQLPRFGPDGQPPERPQLERIGSPRELDVEANLAGKKRARDLWKPPSIVRNSLKR